MTIPKLKQLYGSAVLFVICVGLVSVSDQPAFAQEGFVGCRPVSERTTQIGCWIHARQSLGRLRSPSPFWHLDQFPSAALAEKAKGPQGTVILALGNAWLLTIAEAGWRPRGGEHVAEVGPLPVNLNTEYTAQYMEAVMNPGMETHVHRHSGPEAWYTEAGETCLETPEGKQVGRKGVNVVVPGDQPMRLLVSGTQQRRSLVLVLHDASQPWMVMANDWTPKRLCGN
jgi:quercetin dioxygenase-like cupin family protein